MLRKKRRFKEAKGQSMVEFALALPVVLLIVFGIIEFGYLLFVFSSVNTASRNAARYGIAVGEVTGGELRYYDCDGIIEAGLDPGRFAGIVDSEFTITYDSGPTTTVIGTCADLAANVDLRNEIDFGDRIVVEVEHAYQPLVTFMGLNVGPFTMTSRASRTIIKQTTILVDP